MHTDTENNFLVLATKLYQTLSRPHGLVACRAPLSMGFPRQKHWSELPFPSPGDLPIPGIKPMSPALLGGFLSLSHHSTAYIHS